MNTLTKICGMWHSSPYVFIQVLLTHTHPYVLHKIYYTQANIKSFPFQLGEGLQKKMH